MSAVADALIVVDVQNGFTKFGALASPVCRDAIPRIVEQARTARARGDHLIFTTDWHRPDDLEFRVFPPHCIQGSDEAEIVDELKAFADGATIVRKRRYSAFFGTELDRVLSDLHPGRVTVAGVCTDICVLHTVAGLRDRDLAVRVPAAAVATFDSPGHAAAEVQDFALAHMRDILGAEIVEGSGR